MLVAMIPFNNYITAEVVDSFNFNFLYKCAIFSFLPSLLFIYLFMNNVRLDIKFPLYQLDWASFILYAVALCLIGYIMVYGQQYYWLEDNRILGSVGAIAILLSLFIVRQLTHKRPYFHLEVFKYRNFWVGAYVIIIFYICRFALGITTTYFQTVLKLDPIHISYVTLTNIFGIVIGVVISAVFVLQHRPVKLLWMYGFTLLLFFHGWMIFLFTTQANEDNFYMPLLVQGLGIGLLMTPSIIFMVASVPERLSVTSAGACLFTRCFGFFISLGLLNYYELYSKSKHFNTFQYHTTIVNPVAVQMKQKYESLLAAHGAAPEYAAKAAKKAMVSAANMQNHIRFAIDYYEMICILLLITILLIALVPYISRTSLTLTKKQPSPF
jgi:hypothetical protein